MKEKNYHYGFRLGWYSGVKEARRAYERMRAIIIDALPSAVPPKSRQQILEALNDFQKSADWEFDVH